MNLSQWVFEGEPELCAAIGKEGVSSMEEFLIGKIGTVEQWHRLSKAVQEGTARRLKPLSTQRRY